MSDDVEYIDDHDEGVCDCGTQLKNGRCNTCRQFIWEIPR